LRNLVNLYMGLKAGGDQMKRIPQSFEEEKWNYCVCVCVCICDWCTLTEQIMFYKWHRLLCVWLEAAREFDSVTPSLSFLETNFLQQTWPSPLVGCLCQHTYLWRWWWWWWRRWWRCLSSEVACFRGCLCLPSLPWLGLCSNKQWNYDEMDK
jgi:hypothetical protein